MAYPKNYTCSDGKNITAFFHKKTILDPPTTTSLTKNKILMYTSTAVSKNILPPSSVATLETKILHPLPPLLARENTGDLSTTLKNFFCRPHVASLIQRAKLSLRELQLSHSIHLS
jgi:hypothetical protein